MKSKKGLISLRDAIGGDGSNIILLSERGKPAKTPTPQQQEFAELLSAFELIAEKNANKLTRIAERYKALPASVIEHFGKDSSVNIDQVIDFLRSYKL